jgi:hypothetical protein
MLTSDDVVHDVFEGGSRLREKAVFAAIMCAAANLQLKRPIHPGIIPQSFGAAVTLELWP